MNNKRGLTTNGMSGAHAILILLSIAMICVSIYLTIHFFKVHFSGDLTTGSFCNISSFWSCDVTTFSALGSILNIPTSVFGGLVGLFILLGSIFPSEKMEYTNSAISFLNFIGCLVLFIYSLVALGGLCPMCVFYYLLSLVVFILYLKKGVFGRPSPKIMGLFGLITVLTGSAFSYSVTEKKEDQSEIAQKVIQQFFSLPKIKKEPVMEDALTLVKSNKKFEETPIRVSVFSDFQCPSCRKISEMLPQLANRYRGNITIQYFFFPLDPTCNHNMSGPLHDSACQASFLATCKRNDFAKIHDEIFEHQPDLTQEWVLNKAKEYNVEKCLVDPKTKEFVKKNILLADSIENGDQKGINATPSIIVNGVMITLVPINIMTMIFDEILKRHNANK